MLLRALNAAGYLLLGLLLPLLVISPAGGQMIIRPLSGVGGGPSYIVDEGFEGTGLPSGWTTGAGTPEYDYTTTVLVPSQSLFMDAATSTADEYVYVDFLNSGDFYAYFKIRFPTVASTGTLFLSAISTAGTTRAFIYIRPGPVLSVQAVGGTRQDCTTTLSTDTTYHVWVSYEPGSGSGSDAVATVAFSTDGVRPTSGPGSYAASTNGTGTAAATRMTLQTDYASGTSAFDAIFDRVLIDDEQIGDLP